VFYTVFPNLSRENVTGGLKKSNDVVVQRVHVFHEPLIGGIIDLREFIELAL
jgi:hypothetical protein